MCPTVRLLVKMVNNGLCQSFVPHKAIKCVNPMYCVQIRTKINEVDKKKLVRKILIIAESSIKQMFLLVACVCVCACVSYALGLGSPLTGDDWWRE